MARRTPPAPVSSDEPVRYIETSALLAAILEHDAEAIEALRADGLRITSALTFAEAGRVIVRAAKSGQLTPSQERSATRALRTFERRCRVVAITDDVLARTRRSFPIEPIRTLDAIHLATAEFLGEPASLMTIVTRDVRIERAARDATDDWRGMTGTTGTGELENWRIGELVHYVSVPVRSPVLVVRVRSRSFPSFPSFSSFSSVPVVPEFVFRLPFR